jgi:hypothetical protein
MAIFDDILSNVPEADRSVLAKYPQIQQSLEDLEAQAAASKEALSAWEGWRTRNWDDTNNATRNEVELRQQLSATQLKLAEAASGSGIDMNFDDTLKTLHEQGFIDKNALAEALKPVATAKDVKASLDQMAAGFANIFDKTVPLVLQHKDEFNEIMAPGKIIEYMSKNGLSDPEAAYAQMVAPRRAEKTTEQHKAEIEKARAEAKEEARREAAMGTSGRIPTDQSGSNPSLGHLQAKILEKARAENQGPGPDDVKLGDQVLAQLGVEDLMKSRQGPVQ